MSQSELLRRVAEALDSAGIDYMLTGSIASSLQGEPRATHDIDPVVAMESRDAAAEGDKLDFWLLTNDPFDRSRFARKYEEELFGVRLKISSPEDTILAKLRWSRLSGDSEKYFLDALRVYEVQADRLDAEYLERWAGSLGVSDLWQRLLREACPL